MPCPYDLKIILYSDMTSIEAREQHRQLLFGENVELAPPLGATATAPLTTLTFNMSPIGKSASAERVTQVADATHAILTQHDDMARHREGALFGIKDPEILDCVASLTAGVISRWEHACHKYKRPSPFATITGTEISDEDLQRTDVQLVLETASAILEVLNLGYGSVRDPRSATSRLLMNFVARRGPLFAQAWANRDMLRDYAEQHSANPDERFGLFTRGRLISYALAKPRDPLRAVVEHTNAVDTLLSPDNLAKELAWPPERVAAVFTPSIRWEIYRLAPRDPVGMAEVVAERLDTLLTTDAIAYILDVDADHVDAAFLPTDRIRIAMTSDPITNLENRAAHTELLTIEHISRQLGWTQAETEELFTPAYLRQLAASPDPMARIQKIAVAFKEQLSLDAIAGRLGWSKQQTEEVFSPAVRRKMVRHNIGGLMKKVGAIAGVRKELIQKYSLPIEIVNYLSTNRTAAADLAARTIQAERASCPPKTGELAWMWTIARDHTAHRTVWVDKVAAYLTFWRTLQPLLLTQPTRHGRELGEYVAASNGDIAEEVSRNEPGAYLQQLAVHADVTYAELQRLMTSLTDEIDEHALLAKDRATLQKLRRAAKPPLQAVAA